MLVVGGCIFSLKGMGYRLRRHPLHLPVLPPALPIEAVDGRRMGGARGAERAERAERVELG